VRQTSLKIAFLIQIQNFFNPFFSLSQVGKEKQSSETKDVKKDKIKKGKDGCCDYEVEEGKPKN